MDLDSLKKAIMQIPVVTSSDTMENAHDILKNTNEDKLVNMKEIFYFVSREDNGDGFVQVNEFYNFSNRLGI